MTYRQISALYNAYADSEFEKQCFDAAIHGIDLKKELRKHGYNDGSSSTNQGDDIFRDQSAYESMTEEQKAEETAKAKERLKQLFSGVGF